MSATLPQHRDNLLGVCHALGEEFGFNPLFLRIALAVSLMWNPIAILIGYALAGVAVLLVRFLIRDRRIVAEPAAPVADNEDTAAPMARAA